MLMTAFLDSSLQLLEVHPHVVALKKKIKGKFSKSNDEDENIRELTLARVSEVQARLVMLVQSILIAGIFGASVPWLLLLVPLIFWLQLCASTYVQQHREAQFGQFFAANVL